MTERGFNVLFLCTANSARSILAEARLNDLGGGRFRAYSAGAFLRGEINPRALALLKEHGMPTEGLRSKSWDEFAKPGAPVMDFVFTVCDQAAGETCPVWPGQPISAHWGIPDPATVEGNETTRVLAFRDACRMLTQRIRIFVSLPFASHDRLSLANQVQAIGRLRPDAAEDVAS